MKVNLMTTNNIVYCVQQFVNDTWYEVGKYYDLTRAKKIFAQGCKFYPSSKFRLLKMTTTTTSEILKLGNH